MRKILMILGCVACLSAQELGTFTSIDEDGHKTAKWQIYEQDGKLFGKISKLYGYNDDTICDKCDRSYKGFTYAPDASKMKLIGAPLLYNLKKVSANEYKDGYIIDPKTGKQYRANAKIEGDKLILRGFIGFALIGRTQTWLKDN